MNVTGRFTLVFVFKCDNSSTEQVYPTPKLNAGSGLISHTYCIVLYCIVRMQNSTSILNSLS